MASCYFLCLDAKKVTKEKSSLPAVQAGAEEKKLKFIAFSYSEKGYYEVLLNIERTLDSAFVVD